MTLQLDHMLSTSVLPPAPRGSQPARPKLVQQDGAGLPDGTRRTRLWEFDPNLHCSSIGTCLTTTELRRILDKLNVGGTGPSSEHAVHALGVTVAGRKDDGAKFLQKALDRRHAAAITRYSRAKGETALLAQWQESLKQGDIPGAYWAALTHPAATDELVKRVFGDVHMLSHLMGAANRADIRRLRRLEQENAALGATVERQQRRLRDGFIARDQTITRLSDLLARQTNDLRDQPQSGGDAADYVIRDLNDRLARETACRMRGERRAGELSMTLKEKECALQASLRECETTRHELEIVERHLTTIFQPEDCCPEEAPNLSGRTLLYVGGRARQVPQLKRLTERAGAHFLHHDGGIEHSSGLLPGLISRADHIFFPVDCISHDAAATIKRLCGMLGKGYRPLRTASLTCLLFGLLSIREAREQLTAE